MLSKEDLKDFCEFMKTHCLKTIKVTKDGFEIETWQPSQILADPKDEKADKLIESINSVTDAELLENPYAGLDLAFKDEASSN